MSWQPEIDELRRREEMARQMGGADKIKRQHDGGKLTVRERIERLLDKDSFHEIGAIAGKAQYDGLLLAVQKRISNNYSVNSNYTLSKCMNDGDPQQFLDRRH